MEIIKSCTSLEQSYKLAEILPLESADMWYHGHYSPWESERKYDNKPCSFHSTLPNWDKPCWSLAALMKILHRNEKDIVSLSYGGYKDGEYILNWCLDYEFEDGDYKKTFSDNPIDACVEMILKLKENNKL